MSEATPPIEPEPAEPELAAEDAPGDDDGAPAAAERAPGPWRLRRARRRLLSRRDDAVWHLGGLAVELHRRAILPEGVMRVSAGRIAEIDDAVRDIDTRLGEIDVERRTRSARRPRRGEQAAGCCLSCRTSFRAEARYCWQCGALLVPRTMGDDQVTAAIPTPDAG